MLSYCIHIAFVYYVLSASFVFVPTNKMSQRSNWLENDRPCRGDHLVYEMSKKTVAVMDENVEISEISLPDDGTIYFGDDVILGEAGRSQCGRRRSPEDVFFSPAPFFPSIFDHNSWKKDDVTQPILHMNMVPGGNDDVTIPPGSDQIFIDFNTTVQSLSFGGRKWTNKETMFMMNSMEEQYKISLGHRIKGELNENGLSMQVPLKRLFVIEERGRSPREVKMGTANTNLDEQVMEIICEYMDKCPADVDCIQPVRPRGHCCHFCGALINFTGIATDKAGMEMRIEKVIKDNSLSSVVRFSLERLDDGETPAQYQIALFPLTGSFDEDVMKATVALVETVMKSTMANSLSVLSYSHAYSKIDRSLTTTSKVMGAVAMIIIIILLTIHMISKDEQTSARIRSWLRSPPRPLSMGVHWKRGSCGDTVELVTTMQQDAEDPSEEEGPIGENLSSSNKPTTNECSIIETLVTGSEETTETEELPLIEL